MYADMYHEGYNNRYSRGRAKGASLLVITYKDEVIAYHNYGSGYIKQFLALPHLSTYESAL